MVISAPTGSGKTVLFELCILRLLSRFLSPDWRFNLNKGTLKTVCADSGCHSSKNWEFRIRVFYCYRVVHWIYMADLHCTLQGIGAGKAAGMEHEVGPIGDQLLGDDW